MREENADYAETLYSTVPRVLRKPTRIQVINWQAGYAERCKSGLGGSLAETYPRKREKALRRLPYPFYYSKEEVPVRMADGSEITGMAYIMCEGYKKGTPADTYYDGIRRAYEKLGLGSQIDTVLEPALARSLSR